MSRHARYETKDELADMQAINDKLSHDLRQHIRAIGSYPVLSVPWCEMAEVLGRVAKVSAMEAKLPKSNQDQTLWEGEEFALRYVMEDGKLNVCLRALVEYKVHEKQLRKAGTPISEGQHANMRKFEAGMGMVLRHVWSHPEAMQTTDLPLLLHHIADVLGDAAPIPAADDAGAERLERLATAGQLADMQESVCMFYLQEALANLEEMGEERVMPLVKAEGLFLAVARVLRASWKALPPDAVAAGAAALALLCATEDFGTYKERYVPREEMPVVASLKNGALSAMIEDADQRRRIRPLLDLIAQYERAHGK